MTIALPKMNYFCRKTHPIAYDISLYLMKAALPPKTYLMGELQTNMYPKLNLIAYGLRLTFF